MNAPLLHSPKICFLIEDNLGDTMVFITALRTLDSSIQVVTAKDGVQALEIINADPLFLPDYIFLDLNMPYMSGKACLISMREVERLKDVPIILHSSIQDFEDLVSLGASGFITKQDSVEALVKVLSGIIK